MWQKLAWKKPLSNVLKELIQLSWHFFSNIQKINLETLSDVVNFLYFCVPIISCIPKREWGKFWNSILNNNNMSTYSFTKSPVFSTYFNMSHLLAWKFDFLQLHTILSKLCYNIFYPRFEFTNSCIYSWTIGLSTFTNAPADNSC